LTGTIDRMAVVKSGSDREGKSLQMIAGKALILLPRENSRLIQYIDKTRNFMVLLFIERVPESRIQKTILENNIGIKVEYIDNLDDILKYAKVKRQLNQEKGGYRKNRPVLFITLPFIDTFTKLFIDIPCLLGIMRAVIPFKKSNAKSRLSSCLQR